MPTENTNSRRRSSTRRVAAGTEQLPLDFTASSSVRMRRARRVAEQDEQKPRLFVEPPNIDIHLHSSSEAFAHIGGQDPDRAVLWLERVVGPVRVVKNRRVAFPVSALDRLLHVRPPAQITLDAAAAAVARAVWAQKLGLRPLRVFRQRQRLLASSQRWPGGFSVKDAPWTTITALTELGVALEVEPDARQLMVNKLGTSGALVANAGLAGSAVLLEARHPSLLEALKLPALSYAGEPGAGRYKMPLLSADALFDHPQIRMSPELEQAARKVTARPRPVAHLDGFPWTLYPFQAIDTGRAAQILEVTGGVLLAGEMGSGKTTVALALAHKLDIWPLLVVAPLSAFSTWGRQLGEMGKRHYLATDSLAVSWSKLEHGELDAVVVSYDRLFAFVELIERLGFRGIVADEIQRIRTPGSRRSRALRALAAAAPYRIGLSGTPLTNTVSDLLPIGSFLAPSEWRPRANSRDLEDLYPGDPVESVAEHLGTMMVRRRMDDVGAKLPRRNDHRVYVDLTPDQRRALADLEAEANAAKTSGEFDDPRNKLHAFVRLQRMRQIINAPSSAGIAGPNPKVVSAIRLALDFLDMGRKGVMFCADRSTFKELGDALDASGVGWVGIWGSTPPNQRIENERRFHTDPDVKVVLCTIQAGGESWSASPTATWLVSTAYMYAPASLSQMEARVYRMNSDPTGPDIEIVYVHASAPGGSLDDRMVEILGVKKQLFAQVVDRSIHTDTTKVHYSMGDLVYLMTGRRDTRIDAMTADAKRSVAEEQKKKQHARATAHRRRKVNQELWVDDGSTTSVLDEACIDASELDAEVNSSPLSGD